MADDIDKQLDEQRLKQAQLKAQVSQASDVLDQVQQKIEDMTARQQKRMRSDERIETRIADQLAVPTETKEQKEQKQVDIARAQARQQGIQRATDDSAKVQLVPDTLTADQINIKPGERITDRPFLFSETIEHSQAAVSLKNSAGHYMYANRTVHDLYDAAPGSMHGTSDIDWVPEEIAEEMRRTEAQVLKTNDKVESLDTATAPDGRVTYWYSHKFTLPGDIGMLLASIAFDVTELVDARGRDKAMEIGRTRYDKMETLKQQLARLARQIKDKPLP